MVVAFFSFCFLLFHFEVKSLQTEDIDGINRFQVNTFFEKQDKKNNNFVEQSRLV